MNYARNRLFRHGSRVAMVCFGMLLLGATLFPYLFPLPISQLELSVWLVKGVGMFGRPVDLCDGGRQGINK